MKDFITLEIESSHNKHEFFKLMSAAFPQYRWKMGSSDYNEDSVTGIGENLAQIKIWMSQPIEVSLSFRRVTGENKADWKAGQFEAVKNELAKLGAIANIRDFD